MNGAAGAAQRWTERQAMKMTEKYVKLSDVKKKMNYICRTYLLGKQIKESISGTLANIPYTTLKDDPRQIGEWIYGEYDVPHCSECGTEVKEISPFCPQCGSEMGAEH